MNTQQDMTLGSLFAGIGGFDYGFEQAGWRTAWQVEINPVHRAHLALRFPRARQFSDIASLLPESLQPVDCITGGFPCTDISVMGNARRGGQPGLAGARSGLFEHIIRLARVLQPRWLVLENVPRLLTCNAGQDFARVVGSLAELGYLGYARVLSAEYFGVPQKRRRLFLVAGLGQHPPPAFMADAAPMAALSRPVGSLEIARIEDRSAMGTLTAQNSASRIGLGSEILVAEADGWDQMVERERIVTVHGLPSGLAEPDLYAHYGAGNAVVPAIARWIGEILMSADTTPCRAEAPA